MNQEGYVSLWIGKFESEERFMNYISIEYDEDGDALLSEFEINCNVEYYDIDFREIEFYKKPLEDLKDLLKGFSYDDVIIPKFIKMYERKGANKVNSIVLLYNFKYDKKIEETKFELNTLQYIGTVRYK